MLDTPNLINLRGHHLLCLLTWMGEGYTDEFTNKFDAIAKTYNNYGSLRIKVAEGLDDLCKTLDPETTPDYHCDLPRNKERDSKALHDINQALELDLQYGSEFELTATMIDHMRRFFQNGIIRSACMGCQWHDFCGQIAKNNFTDARITNIEKN